MEKDFYKRNRNKLIEKMKKDSIAIVFSGQSIHRSADAEYPFLVNRNFYYLTGLEEENIILMIIKKEGEIQEELFIEQADPLKEKWIGKKYSKEEVENISGITRVSWIHDFKQRFTSLLDSQFFENVYLDLERTQWDQQGDLRFRFSEIIKDKFPYLLIKNLYSILREFRTIKEPEEVEKIQKAIAITKEGIHSLMKQMRPGLKTYQLEAYFDFAIGYAGARDNAFESIIAPGEKAVILHYVKKQDTIKEGELVLFDVGADYQHYCGDISRTLPVSGKFTPRQKELYNIVLKAEEEVIQAIKPGLPFNELNQIAKKVLAEECIKIGFIQKEEEISQYYYHGVSHYLGLDTHDIGRRNQKLEPGMVLTVEPGLYVEEEKIGIRIEDDVLVTKEGCQVLSKEIPKKIEDIEAIMG
ncbi:aminopeptidase P N-terminal domain-containing protein [Garciella nitratireducens]|uniref:aminopeptidase P N-terminal domain-containing protein n=1 Tax=Garciella nitratireducens TaxID=218205 RepID=UPI000DE852E3|nr:aminopeptidase P N-terminal domain-containing protein [Garciella nitratireducens]RBP38704.1 Xaa-Pro aminopeptidase [Garciella nitratireducens]